MKVERIEIGSIPALVWVEASDKVFLCVHGKMGSKECVAGIAETALKKGYQTIRFAENGFWDTGLQKVWVY